MADPDAERAITTNAAAFRFWLRALGVPDQSEPTADMIRDFAGIGGTAAPLSVLAVLLLKADLRPDDRTLVAGLPERLKPLLERLGMAAVFVADARPDRLRELAAEARATVVMAPPAWLAQAGLGPDSTPRGIYPCGLRASATDETAGETAGATPARPT
jgi:hypothetical protein